MGVGGLITSDAPAQVQLKGVQAGQATAGAFGVPLSEVTAQLAILSERGFPTAHVAAMNWAGMLRSLEGPTDKGLKGMQALGHATGVDLVGDIKRLQADGAFLPQFLADVHKATGGDFNKMRLMMPQSSYATALMGLVRNLPDRACARGCGSSAKARHERTTVAIPLALPCSAWTRHTLSRALAYGSGARSA
jgi:hypothetical protein